MDTAGQEKYFAVTQMFYKRACGVLLVFDITSRESFEKMQDFWIKETVQNTGGDVIILIVGNKLDLEEKR